MPLPDHPPEAADPARPPVWGVLYRTWPTPDGGLRFEFLSERAENLLEATADEVARMLADRTMPITGVDPEAFYRSVIESVAAHTPWAAEFGFVGPRTGTRRWVRAQDFPRHTPDGVPYFEGVVLDITNLKRAEENARAAVQTFAAHLENSPLAVIEWDADMRVVRWSGRAEEVFGWTAAEVLGKHFDDWRFVHDEDAARIDTVGRRLATGTEPRNVVRNRNYHKSGRILHCEWHNSILADDRGAVASVLSMVLDVTARVEAQERAARSEERLRTALAVAGMLGWDLDLDGKRAFYSADYAGFYGLPAESGPAAPGLRTLADHLVAVHPDDYAAVKDATTAALATGEDLRVEFRGAVPAADGSPRWFVTRGKTVRGADGSPARVLGVTAEITDRKRAEAERIALEREVQDARRRESLGVLAGGVAHDLNNILTVIQGYAQLVQADPKVSNGSRSALTEVEKACQRAAELCRQMTAFAGTGRVMTDRLALPDVVRAAADQLTAAARPAALTLDLPDPPAEAHADPFQVRQLLLNLVRNAGESGGSAVTVRTGSATLLGDVPAGFAPPPLPGRYATIDVTDDGAGMDDRTRASVFDPFFTTKGPGRGLGMAAVFGIVRSHRGSIRVESSPGRGTTVRVLLPASPPVRKPAAVTPVSWPRPVRAAVPAGLALVVDDEPNIRELSATVLEDAGFEAVVAGGAAEALARFRERPTEFRLAVIDVVMPGMSGSDLTRELRAARPSLPVVLMTGYTASQLPDDLTRSPRTVVLAKPFRLEQLAAAARAAVPL